MQLFALCTRGQNTYSINPIHSVSEHFTHCREATHTGDSEEKGEGEEGRGRHLHAANFFSHRLHTHNSKEGKEKGEKNRQLCTMHVTFLMLFI